MIGKRELREELHQTPKQYMVVVATRDDDYLKIYDSHLDYDSADDLATTLELEVDEFDNELYEQVMICEHGDYIFRR